MDKEYVDRIKGIAGYGYILKTSGNVVIQSSIEMAFDLFKKQETMRKSKQFDQHLKEAALLLVLIAAGALFAGWTVQRTDREMRAELLQQTRMVAQAIGVERIQALSGTEADLHSDDYVRIKEQLSAIRLGNPKCRFIYLMGRKYDGTVFFFVDSEQVGSKDYSPPGQVYKEVTEDYRRVFDTKAEDIVGPATDRWGTWISGLVPISCHQSDPVLAVLGLDIDARAWKRNLAARAILPVGLMLVMLFGVFFACCLTMR